MKNLTVRPSVSLLNNRDAFLTTFDQLFDEVARGAFPSVFEQFGAEPFGKAAYPKVNVVSLPNAVQIETELAGFSRDNINIEVVDGTLTISGKSTKEESTDKVYLLRELKRSAFTRSFRLGEQLDASKIDAQFDNGLLTITIPKLTQEKVVTKVTIK